MTSYTYLKPGKTVSNRGEKGKNILVTNGHIAFTPPRAKLVTSILPTCSITNMKNTLVLITDLGGFKAYRLENNPPISSPRLELLEEYKDIEAHRKLVEHVTDQSGRFPRRAGAARAAGAMSDGERHNIELERRKRGVRKLAGRLDSLMQDPSIEQCYLAASREIMNPLLDELSPNARSKIGMNIPSDLMKASKVELLKQFRV